MLFHLVFITEKNLLTTASDAGILRTYEWF